MASRQVTQLVKMANQIALNLGAGHDDAAADRTAEHISRFWTPAMRRQLLTYWRDGGELAPMAGAALAILEQAASNGGNTE